MREKGVNIEVVPNDEHGQISVTALTGMMDDRVKVVAISYMPSNGGLVQPAAGNRGANHGARTTRQPRIVPVFPQQGV